MSPHSATVEWHPHLDTWLLIFLISFSYWLALSRRSRSGDERGQGVVSRGQLALFSAGLLVMWAASDYPIHDIAENYLFSVHMLQHMLLTLVVPPLLLLGTPDWLFKRVFLGNPNLRRAMSLLARPLIAGILFNAVTVITHWPTLVNASLTIHPFHFVVHAVMFASALLMWFPVINHMRELPTMSYPGRMLYLFLQSVVPTVPASFITFASQPVYSFYAKVPRLTGLSAVEDQQIAGALMKVGGAAILWSVIILLFFRWYSKEHHENAAGVLTWDDVEKELRKTDAPL